MKCNDDSAMLQTLAGLGLGFDCASKVTKVFLVFSGCVVAVLYSSNFCALRPPLEFCRLVSSTKIMQRFSYAIIFDYLQAEIKKMLDIGVSPSRIVFANPCKTVPHLRFAATQSVDLMTFDNMMELEKVKKHYPQAR